MNVARTRTPTAPLFAAAFGSPDVTSERISRAVAQFLAFEAFLNTFTDNEFLTDPKFSDPFH